MSAASRSRAADRPEALILGRADVAALMTMEDWLAAAEAAFRLLGEGRVAAPAPLHVPAQGGGLHAKAAAAELDGLARIAIKANANFPANRERFGLPTIQGVALLFDGADGTLLAIIDSVAITAPRTAAATALAARHLARPDSRRVAIIGCGEQGWSQLMALRHVLPIEQVAPFDIDDERAEAFAARVRAGGLDADIASDPRAAARTSDVVVTCTTATAPLLGPGDIATGAFVAAIGADAPHKQELEPALLACSKLVVDVLDQCVAMGELHHAPGITAHAELGEIVTGRKAGRESDDEIIVFDSTGTGVQDLTAAARIRARALESGTGRSCTLS